MIYWFPLLYLVMINAVTFLAMWWDKRKAVRNQWRVAEVTLQLLGIIGGVQSEYSAVCTSFAIRQRRCPFWL
jgi:uncharacterized membrane protein YsdA (DUF1294 family)